MSILDVLFWALVGAFAFCTGVASANWAHERRARRQHPDSADRVGKVARIAMAIQRAGPDYMGDVSSVHRDFIALLELIPRAVPASGTDGQGDGR